MVIDQSNIFSQSVHASQHATLHRTCMRSCSAGSLSFPNEGLHQHTAWTAQRRSNGTGRKKAQRSARAANQQGLPQPAAHACHASGRPQHTWRASEPSNRASCRQHAAAGWPHFSPAHPSTAGAAGHHTAHRVPARSRAPNNGAQRSARMMLHRTATVARIPTRLALDAVDMFGLIGIMISLIS